MSLKKNDIYSAEIIDYTTDGSGICKIEGMTVFVPNTVVGDKVSVRILKANKKYAYGKIEEISEQSYNRIEPDCGIFNKCGGCTFRHINYQAELQFKQKRVYDALTRIGGVDGKYIDEIIGSDRINNYRNKVQLPFMKDDNGEIGVGFFAPRSHRVIPLKSCMLQSEVFEKAIRVFLEWANSEGIAVYDESIHSGILRHLYLRYASKTNELMVCVIINADKLKNEKGLVKMLSENLPELKSVVINSNTEKTNVIIGKKCRTIYGDGYITDELCGLKFRISPLSFYQVNRDQAEKLYSLAADFANLNSGETLVDMYCGIGTIGLTMAKKVKNLIGAEIVSQAIEDAEKNKLINSIDNAEFICADAAKAAKILEDREVRPDCIIIDPPRKGCGADLIEMVSEMNPKRIVYVSCDPATLARDVKLFREYGYSVNKAVPVDMFPRTAHVETVVSMSRNI